MVIINKATYNFMSKNVRSGLHWYCRICEGAAGKILSAVSTLTLRQDALEKKLAQHSSRIDELDQGTGDLGNRVADQHARLDRLEHQSTLYQDKVSDVEGQLKQQKEQLEALADSSSRQHQTGLKSDESPEQQGLVSEVTKNVNESLERRCNIVMFNVPESNSNLKEVIVKEDIVFVQEMCRYLAGEDLRYTTKRLGKRTRREATQPDQQPIQTDQEVDHIDTTSSATRNESQPGNGDESKSLYKPRPLHVQFENQESKAKIMKKLYKLGNSDKPEILDNISVKHDMTPSERKHEKELRSLAKSKNEEWTDLNIKYKITGPPWERKLVTVQLRPREENPRHQENQAAPSGSRR